MKRFNELGRSLSKIEQKKLQEEMRRSMEAIVVVKKKIAQTEMVGRKRALKLVLLTVASTNACIPKFSNNSKGKPEEIFSACL